MFAILCECGHIVSAADRPTAWTMLNNHQVHCGARDFIGYESGAGAWARLEELKMANAAQRQPEAR